MNTWVEKWQHAFSTPQLSCIEYDTQHVNMAEKIKPHLGGNI